MIQPDCSQAMKTKSSEFSPPSISKDDSECAPIIGSSKQKRPRESDEMASRSKNVPLDATNTAATVTPAAAIATPAGAPATLTDVSAAPTKVNPLKPGISSPKAGANTSGSVALSTHDETRKLNPTTKTGDKFKPSTSKGGKRRTSLPLATKSKAFVPKTVMKEKRVISSAGPSIAEPPAKRTKGFKSRRGPSFQAAEVATASVSNDVPTEFSTTCFYVQLGDEGQTYFIHEHHLSKSPRLLDEVKAAKGKCRKTQQQIIQLLPHNAGAFGQMVGYLYSDQFKPLDCNKGIKMIGHRMKEIYEVMSLAKYYNMPGFQKDIMRVVSKDRLVHKVSVAAFFDWAEDMWYEEMDKKNGPFTRYLQRHAPAMLHSATYKDLKSMMRFIGGGGEYVKELFVAMHKAIALRGESVIKSEPDVYYG